MKLLPTLALSSLLILSAGFTTASGAIITYNVVLNGGQAVPANSSTGSGSATVTIDDVLNTVSVNLIYTGLTGGNASAAHIHCCVATNANGPVVIPFNGFPPQTFGTYINTFTGVSAANIAGIIAGQAYINIHNTGFPGGEIRGNINAGVPEPTTLSLLGLGVLAILGGRARRKA